MSTDQWQQVSQIIDYIMAQPNKPIKESPSTYSIKGEPEKPKKKQVKKEKPTL